MTKVNLSAVEIILPFEKNELEPYISEEAIGLHLLHHKSYLNNFKKMSLEYQDLLHTDDLESFLMQLSYELEGVDFGPVKLFQNAAQIWNHNFFWQSMSKNKKPSQKIFQIIEKSYGSIDNFRASFIKEGMSGFGSYWLWIVLIDKNKIDLLVTQNADSPNFSLNSYHTSKFSVKQGEYLTPLINCDIWEHSFYVDYKNEKKKYLETFFDHLINWDFAERRMKDANSSEELI